MYKISYVFLTVVFFALTLAVAGQNPNPTPPPSEDDDVVKITTTLIQLDVVVTDKDGKPVTDLKPEDFRVYQDGKLREITNFSYVNSETSAMKALFGSIRTRKPASIFCK